MDGPSDFAKEIDSMFDGDHTNRPSSSSSIHSMGVPPARAPLSWARRPTSQSSERPSSRNRPLSMVAAENAAVRTSTPAEQAPSDQTTSRDQISQALAGKDPSWFRQTADRGQSSAAYRRNQVEDQDTLDMSSMRAQLPGMSRKGSTEPAKETSDSGPTSPTSRLQAKLASPLALSPAQRLEPPTPTPEPSGEKDVTAGGRASPTRPSSPTRPLSPTKGMGGFVQSAMMKRSDSVKRWSVNSPAGLQRADSVVSPRPGHARSHSRHNSTFCDDSVTPTTSRPTSSLDTRDSEIQEKPTAKEETPVAETKEEEEQTALPVSPTKTMDPRRWSPTKASWLDAQLNRPESPKAKATPPTSHQPAWMVELNKAKASKANVGGDGIDRASSVARKHEVKTGGLMRSTPMGANVRPGAIGGTGGPLSPRLPSDEKLPVSTLRGTLVKRGSETGSLEGGESSTPTKTKPATPPKKDLDFRGNLKPRQAPATGTSGPPEEFKNVFGTLRRTKTQNYVAPDELKSNILRGKAGLNNAGGPKPSERKDELKEAILKKKDDFKKAQQEGHGVTKAPAPSTSEKPLPEALAKKLEIKRSATISKRDSATSDAAPENPSGISDSNRSRAISSFSRSDSAGARPLPSPKPTISAENEPPVSLPALHKEVSAPARLQGRVGGGALADRFNPALAGILARGPPGAGASSDAAKSSSVPASQTAPRETEPEAPSGPGPQLTHMTKSRARGPKRKAPSSIAKLSEDTKTTSEAPSASQKPALESPPITQQERFEPRPEVAKVSDPVKQDKPVLAPKSQVVSLADSSKKSVSEKKPEMAPVGHVISLVDSSKKPSEEEAKPAGQPIFKTRARSPTKVHEQVAALAAKSQSSSTPTEKEEAVSRPASPTKNVLKRISKFIDEPVQVGSPADTNKSLPPSPAKSLPPSPVKSRALPEPTPSASRDKKSDDKVDAEPVVSVRNGRNLFGGASFGFAAPVSSKPADPTPEPVVKTQPQRPRTPPQLSNRPLPAPPVMSPPPASPVRSPMTKYNMEVTALLTDFFGHSRPRRSYNVDAADILMQRPPAGSTITTRQAQLFQVSGDGKKVPVSAHYERVLFEREMYLCTHTFTTEAGKKMSEVYFWTGDEVPESTVQDAQLFAQRDARSYGGKLIKLTQGKESPEFLQALGGIVTVRRGSSNKYDSLAPNMLCGRRYRGQITFDEVDFSPSSLCSGFPYLITQQGKCYLWKGKGSDVDELSCARLIGMDLALMGELEEVEDGDEPAGFWNIFDGGARLGSADHWRLKPNYDKYCGRLFRSDAADRKQVCPTLPLSSASVSRN